MTILLWGIFIVVLLLLGILFIPLRYHIEGVSYSPYKGEIKAQWLGKLFLLHLLYVEGNPFFKQLYIGGKVIFGPEKDYEVWLNKRVKDEFKQQTEEAAQEKEALSSLQESFEEEKLEKALAEAEKAVAAEQAKIEEDTEKEQAKTNEGAAKGANNKFWWRPYVMDTGLYEALFTFLKRSYDHSKPRDFYLEGTFGLGDPYKTGVLAGILYALWPQYMQRVSFSYLDLAYEGRFKLMGRIYPGLLLWYLVCFLWQRPVRQLIRGALRARKGKT